MAIRKIFIPALFCATALLTLFSQQATPSFSVYVSEAEEIVIGQEDDQLIISPYNDLVFSNGSYTMVFSTKSIVSSQESLIIPSYFDTYNIRQTVAGSELGITSELSVQQKPFSDSLKITKEYNKRTVVPLLVGIHFLSPEQLKSVTIESDHETHFGNKDSCYYKINSSGIFFDVYEEYSLALFQVENKSIDLEINYVCKN